MAAIALRWPGAATERACAQRPPTGAITVDDRAMIAVQLMNRNHLRRATNRPAGAIKPEGEHRGTLPTEKSTRFTAPFQPLDTSIVSEAIPVFFIGRNKEGFWVARDAKGQIGGIFLLENSALSFARKNSQPTGCATIFPSERFELDLENNGNPLVGHLGSMMRLTKRPRQRMAAFIGKMTEAVKRRLNDFDVR